MYARTGQGTRARPGGVLQIALPTMILALPAGYLADRFQPAHGHDVELDGHDIDLSRSLPQYRGNKGPYCPDVCPCSSSMPQ